MCELFGLTGPDEILLNEYLETFAGHSVNHPNGWGIAIFCGKEVNIDKEPVAAYRSSYLKERLRTPLRAANMMAHIRFATTPLNSKKWEPVEPCRLQAYKNGRHVLSGTAHQNEYIENPEDMKLIFLDYAQL